MGAKTMTIADVMTKSVISVDATITVNEYIATDEGYAALWTAYQNVNSGDKDLYAARIWFLIGSACFSPELLSCKMFLLSRGVLFN